MTKPKVEVGRWDDRDPRNGADSGTSLAPLEALAWLLDSSIQIPGSRFRIGVESLLGLVPIVGDAIGALISTYILVAAARMGVPRVTLLRMGFNVAVEAVVGLIPFAGDLFDFGWKANLRNVALLRAHADNPGRARRGDWVFAAFFVAGIAGLLCLMGWAAYLIGRALRARFL